VLLFKHTNRGISLKTDSATRSRPLMALLISQEKAIIVPGSDVSGEVTDRSLAGVGAASQQFSDGGHLLHFIFNIQEFCREQANHLLVQGQDSSDGSPFFPIPLVKGLDACQEFLTPSLESHEGFQIPSGEEFALLPGDFEKGGQLRSAGSRFL
jgi:hypothetical protein